MTSLPALRRTVEPVVVQTAFAGLPDSDNGWATQRWLRWDGDSEGVGQVVGEAKLVQDFGIVKPQDENQASSVGIAPNIARTTGTTRPLIGQCVRLLVRDDAGSVAIDGDTYTPYWWGRIIASELQPDQRDDANAGGTMVWRAAGLASCFDQLVLLGGIVMRADGSTVMGTGRMPGFNVQPGGDRSGVTHTVNAADVYVHELGNPAIANKWTARDVLEHVLAVGTLVYSYNGSFADPATISAAGGWDLSLADPGTLLDWLMPPIDLHGLTLLQAINAIVSRKRGMTWKLAVVGSAITVHVYSVLGSPVSVPGFVMPASDYTASVVAAGSRTITDVQITEDRSALANIIEVRGGFPWVGMPLAFRTDGTGQLHAAEDGWSSALETAWDSDPSSPLVEQVWRHFLVDPQWNGSGYGGEGGLEVASDSDGVRSDAGPMLSARAITGERMLPCSVGFGSDAVGPRQPPTIVVTGDGTTWQDMTGQWRVEVQSQPLAVVIDDGAFGGDLKRWVTPNGLFVVTVGMREFIPLRVWWQDDQANWQTPTPTVKLIEMPNLTKWRIAAGAITGVNPATSVPYDLVGDLVLRDDTPVLQQVLAYAVAWYGQPLSVVTWKDQGVLDVDDAFAPGRLVTSVQLGDTSWGLYAVITRRQHVRIERDGVLTVDTVYITEAIVPDLESVL